MPMNVASIAHGAMTLNYKQATLESFRINHIVKKRHFSIWTQIFAPMFEWVSYHFKKLKKVLYVGEPYPKGEHYS